MKLQHFVGIDISAATLDVCVLADHQLVLETSIKNQLQDIRKFFLDLDSKGIPLRGSFVCAEHTGTYGEQLRIILESLEVVYFMVPAMEIKQSIGITRGKNDRIDARRIAEYCCRFLDRLTPSKLPARYLKNLKDLFTYRESRVKARTARKNQLKKYQRSQPSAPRDYIITDLKNEIDRDNKCIASIEQMMQRIIKEEPEANKNFELITSVVGAGPIIACYMLIVTENFTLFANTRKFASYSGIAPFEHQSGTSVRGKTKTSKLRNKQAKTLILKGVNSAIAGKGELAKYYHRKISEGKHKNVVKNAVAFKLVGRIFAVVHRQTPYLQTYADKVAA